MIVLATIVQPLYNVLLTRHGTYPNSYLSSRALYFYFKPFLPSFPYSSAAPYFSLSFHDSICTPSVFSTYLRSFRLLAPIPLQSGIWKCLLVRNLCKNFHDSLRGKSLNRRLLRLVPSRSRLTRLLRPLLTRRHRPPQQLHLLHLQHHHLPPDQSLNLLSCQRLPMDPKNT